MATPAGKSPTGKVLSVLAGGAAVAGVATGMVKTSTAPIVCNGTERWPVKVTSDADARGGKINLTPEGPYTVTQVNDQMRPQTFPTNGRMAVEEKVYTVHGFLSYFKQEKGAKGDRDYHVVIADHPGAYQEDDNAPPTGQSMVVEFPDPECFGGKSGDKTPSALGSQIADARATFEQHIKWPKETRLTLPIPVTVTGVGFFDFEHKQTGRAKPYPDPLGKKKVFELHPVTEIAFDNDSGGD